LTVSDQDFEPRLERLLRDEAELGVRPVDAGAVAHVAAGGGSRQGGWAAARGLRYALVAGLVVVTVVAAFGLGSRLLVLPAPTPTPGPTPTAIAQSPAATVTPTPTVSPSASPTLIPTSTPTLTPGTSPTPTVEPTAAPTPTPTPVAVPTANPKGWVELTGFPSYGAQTHVTGIAFGGDRFVAVGWSIRNNKTHGRVWTSLDGLAWTAQQDAAFAGLSLEAITYNGSQFYAFASAPTTLWHSADGSAWQEVDLPLVGNGELGSWNAFNGSAVLDATSVGSTMFAAGEASVTGGDIACDGTCVAAWRSTNGTDWNQSVIVDGDSFQTFASMPGLSVAVTHGSYIGKSVWSSTDFDTWAHPDTAIPEGDGFLDAASDGSRIVLVGYGSTTEDDYGAAVGLVTNGSGWDVVSIDESSGPAEQLTWAAGRFVAVGTGPGVIVTWWSTDGQTWTRGPDVGPALSLNLGPVGGDDPFNHRTIGAGAPGVVLTQTGTDRLHVWFAPMSAFGS